MQFYMYIPAPSFFKYVQHEFPFLNGIHNNVIDLFHYTRQIGEHCYNQYY